MALVIFSSFTRLPLVVLFHGSPYLRFRDFLKSFAALLGFGDSQNKYGGKWQVDCIGGMRERTNPGEMTVEQNHFEVGKEGGGGREK